MKKSKLALLAGVAAASTLFLAACGSSSNSSKGTTYKYVYSIDPDTLNYLTSNRSTTSDITTNLVDGLFENDQYGNLIPALAEDWSVSKDGLTYTYKLRKDAKWYDSEGNEYADVTAKDFVTSLKYVADKKSDALYLVQNSVKGLDDYVNGKTKDFSTVGVKAVDDHTLQYTLNQPESFWNSKLTTSTMMPVNAKFLESAGKDFGSVKPTGILYNGPYIMKSFTSKSQIELDKNPNYYDKKNVHIDTVKLTYFDGSDQDYLARNFSDGNLTSARLFPTSSTYSTIQKKFKDNIIYSQQDATVYYAYFNVNRQNYGHTSKKSDEQKNSTKTALQNKDFRQALNFALDRTSYSAQSNGKEAATKTLRSLLVPPTFVQANGKDFGTLVEQKLATAGDEWKGVSFADAQDSLHNTDKAKAEFEKAKAALQSQGVQFPIHIDYVVDQSSNSIVQQADSMKNSIETALGKDNVVIDVQKLSTDDADNATYFAQSPEQKDFDLDIGGWGPDFQDPSTYLDILNPTDGPTLTGMGLDPKKDQALIEKLGLNEYKQLLDDANAEKLDTNKRYEKYAAAQAWLTENAIVLPIYSKGGVPSITKVTPFSSPNSLVGIKGDTNYFKYKKVQDKTVTTADYEKAYKEWLKDKAESNKKAQADLAKHVK
uniref:peptide ABC transporter substrate-binding protein n=1 Tax=uncultured Streptococcus sp. TaxID=83427 RepID=UPI0025F30748|nr:peptide ABC transporter substrate-binding protein [uncultured Streptococcus sp.]